MIESIPSVLSTCSSPSWYNVQHDIKVVGKITSALLAFGFVEGCLHITKKPIPLRFACRYAVQNILPSFVWQRSSICPQMLASRLKISPENVFSASESSSRRHVLLESVRILRYITATYGLVFSLFTVESKKKSSLLDEHVGDGMFIRNAKPSMMPINIQTLQLATYPTSAWALASVQLHNQDPGSLQVPILVYSGHASKLLASLQSIPSWVCVPEQLESRHVVQRLLPFSLHLPTECPLFIQVDVSSTTSKTRECLDAMTNLLKQHHHQSSEEKNHLVVIQIINEETSPITCTSSSDIIVNTCAIEANALERFLAQHSSRSVVHLHTANNNQARRLAQNLLTLDVHSTVHQDHLATAGLEPSGLHILEYATLAQSLVHAQELVQQDGIEAHQICIVNHSETSRVDCPDFHLLQLPFLVEELLEHIRSSVVKDRRSIEDIQDQLLTQYGSPHLFNVAQGGVRSDRRSCI